MWTPFVREHRHSGAPPHMLYTQPGALPHMKKSKKKKNFQKFFFRKLAMSRPPLPGGAIPDFSQKKGVHHVMRLIFTIYHAQNKTKLMTQIRVIGKNGHFWAILTPLPPGGPYRIFFQKSGRVTFLHLSCLAFMQKIGTIQCAIFEKSID